MVISFRYCLVYHYTTFGSGQPFDVWAINWNMYFFSRKNIFFDKNLAQNHIYTSIIRNIHIAWENPTPFLPFCPTTALISLDLPSYLRKKISKKKYDSAKHRSQSEKGTISTIHTQNMVTFTTIISYFDILILKSFLLIAPQELEVLSRTENLIMTLWAFGFEAIGVF